MRRLVGTVLTSVVLVAPLPGTRAADAGTPGAAKPATQEGFRSLVAALSGSWVLAVRAEPEKEGAPAS